MTRDTNCLVLITRMFSTSSGCSKHVTFRKDWFAEFRPRRDGSTISLGDNEECAVTGEGTVIVNRLVDGAWRETRIENVLYVPDIRKNLFSVRHVHIKRIVIFRDNDALVMKDKEIIAIGAKQSNEICRLFFRTKISTQIDEANVSMTSLRVCHERLGHLNKRALTDLFKKGVVSGIKVNDKSDFFCDACQLGKSHKLSYNKIVKKVSRQPGEYVYSDVCGPMSKESLGGARFFVMFKDDASGYRQVFFLKHKSYVFESFKIFERALANKFGRVMKTLHSDNGREYCNESMKQYMQSRGIKHESAPYTPEQNGKAERDNRTVVECARTMM